MRVTFATVNRNVQRNLSTRYSNMVNLQEQLATGKRLRKPSDDPIDVANTLNLRTKQVQLKQYKRNIEDGLAVMGVASSAMTSMNEMLHRMRELAVQAANDTNATADRQYIQQEVDQLSRQMLSVINTQFKGDYIFNGTQSKVPPYEIKASKSELMDYLKSTMATYGGDYIRNYAADNNPNDYVYLDYDHQPSIAVGDKLQMKWSRTGSPINTENDTAAGNFLPDSLDIGGGNRLMDTIHIDINGDGLSTDDEIFRRYNGIDDPEDPNYISDPDYAVDYRTGEVTVLSTRFRDTLNLNPFNSASPVVAIPSANKALTFTPPMGINFKYSTTNTVQIIGGNTGAPIDTIFPGSLKIKIGGKEYLEGFGEYDAGYYDKEGVFHEGENKYDYSVDYQTGQITIYNLELLKDMRPPVPIDGNIKYDYRLNPNSQYYDPRLDVNSGYADPRTGIAWTSADYADYLITHNTDTQYRHGQFELTFEYLERGVNLYGDKVGSNGQIYRAIEEGITMNINIGVDDLLRDKWTGNEMIGVMLRYSEALHTADRDGIQKSIGELTTMYDAVLNSQSQMGARIYRLELTQTRNEEQTIEVGTQQSSLEDADLADVISKLMLAENVYNAALQAAMRVLQPSLANFM